MFRVIYVLLLFLLLSACSKEGIDPNNHKVEMINGIKRVTNENRPSVSLEKLNIKIRKVGEISTISNPDESRQVYNPFRLTFLNADSFLLINEKNIWLANHGGVISRPLTRRGQGPGEIILLAKGAFTYNDSICFIDQLRGIDFYDKNLKFLYRKVNKGFQDWSKRSIIYDNVIYNGDKVEQLTDSSLLVNSTFFFPKDAQHAYEAKGIFIFDKNFKSKKLLVCDSLPLSNSQESHRFSNSFQSDFAIGRDLFYVAQTNDHSYEVKCYSKDGRLKSTFKKRFSKIPFSNKEMVYIKKLMATYGKSSSGEVYQWEQKYKSVIRFIYTDREGRVWVNCNYRNEKAKQDKIRFDIFKDGIYLNSVEMPSDDEYNSLNSSKDIYFYNDKIYVIDMFRNRIEIYNY